MEKNEMIGAIEAILYVAGEPIEEEAIRMALGVKPEEIEEALADLSSQYEFERRGIRLLRFGRSVQLSTRPEYAQYIERLLQPVQRQNLTQAAMETLAVIAYRQPATRGDVEAVRGVKCDYSVQSLVNKGLIMEAGKRDTLGKPTLFVTTDAFLRHFGISSLTELPQIDFTLDGQPDEQGDADGEALGEDTQVATDEPVPVGIMEATEGEDEHGELGEAAHAAEASEPLRQEASMQEETEILP